ADAREQRGEADPTRLVPEGEAPRRRHGARLDEEAGLTIDRVHDSVSRCPDWQDLPASVPPILPWLVRKPFRRGRQRRASPRVAQFGRATSPMCSAFPGSPLFFPGRPSVAERRSWSPGRTRYVAHHLSKPDKRSEIRANEARVLGSGLVLTAGTDTSGPRLRVARSKHLEFRCPETGQVTRGGEPGPSQTLGESMGSEACTPDCAPCTVDCAGEPRARGEPGGGTVRASHSRRRLRAAQGGPRQAVRRWPGCRVGSPSLRSAGHWNGPAGQPAASGRGHTPRARRSSWRALGSSASRAESGWIGLVIHRSPYGERTGDGADVSVCVYLAWGAVKTEAISNEPTKGASRLRITPLGLQSALGRVACRHVGMRDAFSTRSAKGG